MIDRDFSQRHIGINDESISHILDSLDCDSCEQLLAETIPLHIRQETGHTLPPPLSESKALGEIKELLGQNDVLTNLIGQGYYSTVTPPVIQRALFENPAWYTAYTPYQAEISQGRLEALLHYQTMVTDLTGLDVSNASLLDEGTAAAEAMAMAMSGKPKASTFFVDQHCHPQTIDVLKTRANPLGVNIHVGCWNTLVEGSFPMDDVFGALIQYPNTEGEIQIHEYSALSACLHAAKALLVVATDLLALTILKEPSQFGADICVGTAQRFGIPLGFGGPHAGFISCRDKYKRKLPGRIIGVSLDKEGQPAYRLSLQTREQHIRRDKATSNICTAQVLLAVMSTMYAIYHGPEGLQDIASRVHGHAERFAQSLTGTKHKVTTENFFDTIVIETENVPALVQAAAERGYNLRVLSEQKLGISFDETTGEDDLENLAQVFGVTLVSEVKTTLLPDQLRASEILQQDVFNRYHTETEMLRYMKRLQTKDLALDESMIPLGSCTMKLNAAAEMMPLSWPEVSSIHPFAPPTQTQGYALMLKELEHWLSDLTGFAATSIQPNAGAQGEYAGLLAIRDYHLLRGDENRDICLIPLSAHGTNPASAVMAGMKVVPISCDEMGNINLSDLIAKAEKHAENLSSLMVTYPSTHGVFEEAITEICDIIHQHGGQVYMDGANMNAQVGLTSPAAIGADVCHLNLHKTFCIPHGGGGPGVGPVCVAEQLVPFLPGHFSLERAEGTTTSAPYGSASINVISWMYIRMMGKTGLTRATTAAILNANYIAHRLSTQYPILYTNTKGRVAHELVLDLRPLAEESGVTVEDFCKRLMDYGYHAPTMSWPVTGTIMIEPTESESLQELDKFCEVMIAIRHEIQEIIDGDADREQNVLKNAPHTMRTLCGNNWSFPYSREKAAFSLPHLRHHKFWPAVSRIDNVKGDRNLICTCDSVEALADQLV